MWECLLGVRHRGCPISDTSASFPAISVQNISKADIPGNRGRRLLHLRGDPDDIAEFVETCRNHESVLSLQRVSSDGSREAYLTAEIEYDDANPSILSILNARGVFHHGGAISVQRGVEHWLVYSERKTTIQEFVGEIESYDNDVSLYRSVNLVETDRIRNVEFGLQLPQLTERQRSTFRTALELGYYDGDSSTTIDDIATDLDLHETTAWEHLKKAENAILTDVGSRLFSTLEVQEA
jgi:predicted DNA binding protein